MARRGPCGHGRACSVRANGAIRLSGFCRERFDAAVERRPVGNGNLVIFTDNTYEFRRDGQIVKSGKYKVVADSSVEQNVCLIFQKGEYAQRVSFDGNVEPKRFFQIFGNKLSFVSGCYAVDAGHKEEYEKVIND